MILLQDDEIRLGMVNAGNLYMGANATGPFEEEIVAQSVISLFTSPHWFLGRADSDVNELADLEGRRVGVGERGSAANYETELIFDIAEIEIEPVYLSWTETADALRQNSIAASYTYAILPAFQQLSQRISLQAISYGYIHDELLEFPTFKRASVPMDVAGADTPVIAQDFYVAANDNFPHEAGYVITRETLENSDHVKETHALMNDFTPESATGDAGGAVSLHSGAAEYYQEAGLLP